MNKVIDRSPIVDLAKKIAEKSNEPMSLNEIVAKFDPGLPFQVRRVAIDNIGIVINIIGTMLTGSKCPSGCNVTLNGGCYISDYKTLDESQFCYKCGKISAWLADIKAWVLV